jgi:PKD repeat protein
MTAARSVTASFEQAKTTSVSDIAMSLRSSWGGTDSLASVTVRDGSGNPVPGATVSGSWSGAVSGTASVVTNSSGKADIRSPRAKVSNGATFRFTVTGITFTGYSYDAAKNVETSDSITVGGAQRPTAVISADVTSGPAPLTVNFSAAGSSDADGTISAYAWSFSDGGSASGVTVQRVFSTPGTYTATLTVTDNAGLTDTKSVTITAGAPGSATSMSVANIGMSLRSIWGRTEAVAAVTVRDGSGNLVPGATVTGTWSGVVSGSASVSTDSAGQASFVSARVSAGSGAVFTLTVTGIVLPGYIYNPAGNVESSDSITR